MEARVQTWICNAGPARGRRFCSGNRRLAAHRRRDVPYWRGVAACKLAMDHFRHHADQQGADGDSAGSCEFTKPGFDCEVESSSLCPDSPWMPRDPRLSDRAVTIRVPRHFGIASWRQIARVREFARTRYPTIIR